MKTIYYTDEQNDDFASTKNIKEKPLPKNYKWIHDNVLWRGASRFLYHCIAFPVIKLVNFFYFGLKVENADALKNLDSGCVVYGNHTQHLDPFIAAEVVGIKHRAYFLSGPDAFSLKIIKHIVSLLGAIPVAHDIGGTKKMARSVNFFLKQNGRIIIYPEAHIWPYYTGIRDFPDSSFSYAISADVPVFSMTVTYRKRRGISRVFFKHPCVSVYVSDPIYFDKSLSRSKARELLKNEVYSRMEKAAKAHNSASYIRYIKKDTEEEKEVVMVSS